MPAASCPSTIGVGRGRLPSITDRSEWHSPAAPIFTSTSPWRGSSSSTSSIASGFDCAYGVAAPIWLQDSSFDLHCQRPIYGFATARLVITGLVPVISI